MTKTPIDYSRTIIYKLCCKDPNIKDIYVGSTTNFRIRKNMHKTCCNNPNSKEYNTYKYQFIRENGGWQNWNMIMIKEYSKCESKRQCLKKERKYVEKLNATLNTNRPLITKKELREDKKEYLIKYRNTHKKEIKDYFIQYREKNRDIINQKRKEKTQCECGSTIRKSDLKRHRKTKKHLKFIEQNQ